jgi:O-antigen ligase/tetratricopeptide (TPR) repeat protein
MISSKIYVKILRWGIFISLFLPLIIFSQYISPFHFGKMVIFRSLVEILAVIYILLIIADKRHLPHLPRRQAGWTPIVISFTVFTALYVLASFIGVDFNYSFWGTLERMGGLFSFLHFWVFFIILISVFRNRKDWEKLLKISIFVGFLSILFAYGQYFKLGDFFVGWQHGERVIGTIGNPALFAGYLLFILFLNIYFLLKKETKLQEKVFYAMVLILGVPALHLTTVRGSIIAFWLGLFLLGLFYLIFPASPARLAAKRAGGSKNRKIKLSLLVLLIIFLILVGFIWINRTKEWVEHIDWLNRLTTISLKTQTLQTRLWSWHSAWQGFKERPILGWGPENFVLAHAKYFDPRLFISMGSETIWDRAHNIVLELLTTMGIVGLLSYLSIFIAIYWFLIKGFKQRKIDLETLAVFGIMLIVYFVHNLFIFDTMANYLMFFLVLGYINFTASSVASAKEDTENKPSYAPDGASGGKEKRTNPFLIAVLVILAIILIYKTNIEPTMANHACTRAILMGRAGNAQGAFNKFQEALSYKSSQGKYEIRQRLAMFAIEYDQTKEKIQNLSQAILNYTAEELKKNIQAHPRDYIPYLYLGRIYILLIGQGDKEAGQKAEEAINSALAINNKNPRIWYEFGQVKLSQKKYSEAVEAFKRALELNPEVSQSYWFLGMAYVKAGDLGEAIKYVDKAIERGYVYNDNLPDIIRLIDLYTRSGDYYKLIDLYKAAIELEPKNAQFYASLAVVYKQINDIENAILSARKAMEIDPSFKEEAERFIKSLGK